jgi:pyruvate dehydrogenase E1 component alpha subunit
MSTAYSLPVLYVVENNLYSETTRTSVHLRNRPITEWVAGYDLRAERVDGMDVVAVEASASELIDGIRDGGGPALLECETYRYHGHFEGDPMTYRSREEENGWRDRDPIEDARKRLLESGVEESRLTEIEALARTEMRDAAEFAASSPWPDPACAFAEVYV